MFGGLERVGDSVLPRRIIKIMAVSANLYITVRKVLRVAVQVSNFYTFSERLDPELLIGNEYMNQYGNRLAVISNRESGITEVVWPKFSNTSLRTYDTGICCLIPFFVRLNCSLNILADTPVHPYKIRDQARFVRLKT